MQPVYGRNRRAANSGLQQNWMDRFAELEPESGVRAVVQRVWKRSASTPNGASPSRSLNGAMATKPVFWRKRLSTEADVPETWMDRFTQLEPEGGVRAVVQLAWSRTSPTSDGRLATLASLIALAGTERAIESAQAGLAIEAAE